MVAKFAHSFVMKPRNALLATAAWCIVSTAAAAAGDAHPQMMPVPDGYKIAQQVAAFQMVANEERPHLQESPYAKRVQQVEEQRVEPVRRHPMRFGGGGALPEVPSFGTSQGALGVLDSGEGGEKVPAPVVYEQHEIMPPAQNALPVATQVDPQEKEDVVSVPDLPAAEMPVATLPETLDAAEKETASPAVIVPDEVPAPVVAQAPVVSGKNSEKPKSFLSGITSLFGSDDDAQPQATQINSVDPVLHEPAKMELNIPSDLRKNSGMQSVVIEKGEADSSADVTRTRQLVIPPEIARISHKPQLNEVETVEPITDRFADEVDTSEPPVKMVKEPIITPVVSEAEKVEDASPVIAGKAPVVEAAPVQELPASVEPEIEPQAEVVEKAPVIAPSLAVPAAPMKREVIMQKLPGMKPVSVPDADEFEPVVPAADVPVSQNEVLTAPAQSASVEPVAMQTLAEAAFLPNDSVQMASALPQESQLILDHIPSGINAPKVEGKKLKVEIARTSNPNLELSQPEVQKHEAMGISIQVKRPDVDANDYLQRGYDAFQAGDLEGALMNYEVVLEAYPGNDDATLALATILHMQGKLEAARKHYRMLLERMPENTDVLNNFLTLISEEAPEAAIAEITDLEKKNPYYAAIPAHLAALYAHQGDMNSAVAQMARAIELAPDDMIYHYHLAIMLEHGGYKADAINAYSLLKKAAEEGKEIPVAYSLIQERLTFLLSNQPS